MESIALLFLMATVKVHIALNMRSIWDQESGKVKKSLHIAISDAIFPSTTQSEFFRNICLFRNVHFISLLSDKLAAADFKLEIASGDGETYIVNAVLKSKIVW